MSRQVRDDLRGPFIVSAGWLFADMLLALAVLFLAADTISFPKPPPPMLTVSPMNLKSGDPYCTGGTSKPQCTVTVGEKTSSQGDIDWTASSDMSASVRFIPAKGRLSPGKSVPVTISAFPCQNGSFTFSGSSGASPVTPVTVLWRCTPPPNDRILEHNYCRIQLDIGDPNQFINDDVRSAKGIVEPQLNKIPFLRGRQVGIAISYGGTIGGSEEQGTEVASQVYKVLVVLANDKGAQMYTVFKTASIYEPLFTGLETSNTAIINVYLVVRPDNPKETCDAKRHAIP
jgi:hypothetical protein